MSHNGRYVATGGSAAVVKLWAYDTVDLIFEGTGHSGAIAGLRLAAKHRIYYRTTAVLLLQNHVERIVQFAAVRVWFH